MKTTTFTIEDIKAPDLWYEVEKELGLDDETSSRYFEFGDYAKIEIEVDEKMNIVGGRFVPFDKKK